jgi:hypothetical protein
MAVGLMLAGGTNWAQALERVPFQLTRSQFNPQSAIRNPQSAREPAAVVIDRLTAIVNGDPIAESDLLWLLSLDPDVPEGATSNTMKGIALRQAIDQQLLYQEAQKLPSLEVDGGEVNQYIAELTGRFPSESIFRRRRQAVGLDDPALREIVKRRLVILHFIEFRFRSFVLVTDQEIQWYYQNRIVRLAEERGEAAPQLNDVRNLIEKTIIQDKVDSEMNNWFDEARRRSEIVSLVEY